MSLQALLVIAAAVFCCGLYTVMTRKNAVSVLMGVELILNAASLNFISFSHYVASNIDGQIFALFVIALAGAEAAVALAIFLRLFGGTGTIEVDEADEMRR